MTRTRKRFVVRALLIATTCALAGALSVTPGLAKTDFGIRGGAYSDVEEPFLGAEALFGVGGSKQWFGNPNLEHAFADTGDLTTVSFDFHYDFASGEPYTIWAGGGPTMIFRDRNGAGGDNTDPGVNLLMGIGAKSGDVRPYGQVKVIVANDSEAVLGVGVRF